MEKGSECMVPAAEVAASTSQTTQHPIFTGWTGQSTYLYKPPPANGSCPLKTWDSKCQYWLDGDAANATADSCTPWPLPARCRLLPSHARLALCPDPGVWFDAWTDALRRRHTDWFAQLKAAGGAVDSLMLDFESSPGPDDLPHFKVCAREPRCPRSHATPAAGV